MGRKRVDIDDRAYTTTISLHYRTDLSIREQAQRNNQSVSAYLRELMADGLKYRIEHTEGVKD